MILPTKKLKPENSLIFLGGVALTLLDEPKTISRIWEEFQRRRVKDLNTNACDVSFDWFVLSLDLLHITGAIDYRSGRLERTP
jgi:hypothetical protein